MIIGLMGPKGSGKDTIADVLVSRHGFTKIAFADTLRRVASILYDIPEQEFTNRHLKDKCHPNLPPFLTRRDIVIQLSKVIKSLDPLVFTSNMSRKLENSTNWVIPDVRFPHEVDYLERLNANLLYVYRTSAESNLEEERRQGILDESESYYPQYMNRFIRVSNDGDLANTNPEAYARLISDMLDYVKCNGTIRFSLEGYREDTVEVRQH